MALLLHHVSAGTFITCHWPRGWSIANSSMCHALYIPECTEASLFSPYIVDDIFTSNFAIENIYIFEISLKFIHWCFVVQPLVSTCNDFMLNIGYAIHIYWSVAFKILIPGYPLELCHYERDGVSNHQPHDCSLNRLFRRRSKKTSKLRVTGLFPCYWPLVRGIHRSRWIPRTKGQ